MDFQIITLNFVDTWNFCGGKCNPTLTKIKAISHPSSGGGGTSVPRWRVYLLVLILRSLGNFRCLKFGVLDFWFSGAV